MSKFFSISGMGPSGGEGEMGGSRWRRQGETVPTETLEKRWPDYYKNRPDAPTSFAEVGDLYKFQGENAKVLHEAHNADGSTEVTVQKSAKGNSGTYKLKTEAAPGRKRVVTNVKRTFE